MAGRRIVYREDSESRNSEEEKRQEEENGSPRGVKRETREIAEQSNRDIEKTGDRELNAKNGGTEQRSTDQKRTEQRRENIEKETEIIDNSLVVWDNEGLRVVSLSNEILVDGEGFVGQDREGGPAIAPVISVDGRPGALVMSEGLRVGAVEIDAEWREREGVSVQQSGESTVAEEDDHHTI